MKLHGLAELLMKLRELEPKKQQALLVKTAKAAMRPVAARVRSAAPVDTGLLRKSVRVASAKPKKGSVVAAAGITIVARKNKRGEKQPNPFYWRFLEKGTSKMSAQPFIRPAFDASTQQVLSDLSQALRKELLRIAGMRGR